MIMEKSKSMLVQFVSIAFLSATFAQAASAGMIDTSYLADSDARAASLNNIQVLLAEESVAAELEKFGVDRTVIETRLDGMTAAELIELDQRLAQEIAGGDAISVIGTVFLVLLILELVGVTDIFKAI